MAPKDYDRKGLMYYLCRATSDKVIFQKLVHIKKKRILDVGIGTGYYATRLLGNNDLSAIDKNPHLNKSSIKVIEADASFFSHFFAGERFDVVFSTWTTEYLSEKQLIKFFNQSKEVLKSGGDLITTFVLPKGVGWLYVKMARYLKGIKKYYYSADRVKKLLNDAGFSDIQISELDALAGLSWAVLVEAKKN